MMGDDIRKIACSASRLLAAVILLLSSCGYSIHPQKSLAVTEVRIGSIQNTTLEPKLQDKLHRALTEEFVKQGVSITPSAKYVLEGVIKTFDMISISEKAGVVSEYRVIVGIDFKLLDAAGKVIKTKSMTSPFVVSVTAVRDLGNLLANKETAEDQAMADIAMEAAGALIFQ